MLAAISLWFHFFDNKRTKGLQRVEQVIHFFTLSGFCNNIGGFFLSSYCYRPTLRARQERAFCIIVSYLSAGDKSINKIIVRYIHSSLKLFFARSSLDTKSTLSCLINWYYYTYLTSESKKTWTNRSSDTYDQAPKSTPKV